MKAGGALSLVKALDGDTVLAECAFPWEFGAVHEFSLVARGNRLEGYIDGKLLLRAEDQGQPLEGGGVALVIEEGRIMCDAVAVSPV